MAENDGTEVAAGEDAGQLRTRFEAQLAEQQRENAMLRSGVDLDSPLGKMFAKGYDGEITPEKIKEAWAELPGVAVAPPVAETPPPSTSAPVTSLEREAIAGNVRLADDQLVPVDDLAGAHPAHAAVGAFWDAQRSGKTQAEAEAVSFDLLFNAAVQGDKRLILTRGSAELG